jgi:hypothetical protein
VGRGRPSVVRTSMAGIDLSGQVEVSENSVHLQRVQLSADRGEISLILGHQHALARRNKRRIDPAFFKLDTLLNDGKIEKRQQRGHVIAIVLQRHRQAEAMHDTGNRLVVSDLIGPGEGESRIVVVERPGQC